MRAKRFTLLGATAMSTALALLADPVSAATSICVQATASPVSQTWMPTESEWSAARAKANAMTLDELAGASMVVRYVGRNEKRTRAQSAKNLRVLGKQQPSRAMPALGASGAILFPDNAKSARQAYLQAKAFSKVMPDSFFTAVDQEGGVVNRLRGDIEPPVSAQKIGRRADIKLAAENAFLSARQLRAARVGMVFAPVADVKSQYTPKYLRPRLHAYNSKLVGQLVAAQVQAYSAQGVMPVVKHFPGIGAIPGDTHKSATRYRYDVARLCLYDVAPFRKAIEAGASAIMVGHGIYAGVENEPATGSRTIVTTLLREEMNFDGIIITDSMTMKAASYGLEKNQNLYIRSLAAGVDLLLMPGNPITTKQRIVAALKNNQLSVEERRESIARVLAYRAAQKRVVATLKAYKPGSEFLLHEAQWFAYELKA